MSPLDEITILERGMRAGRKECEARNAELEAESAGWRAIACGWHEQYKTSADRIAKLEAALRNARETVQHWASYAPDYFREKHDLAADLAAIDEALKTEEGK